MKLVIKITTILATVLFLLILTLLPAQVKPIAAYSNNSTNQLSHQAPLIGNSQLDFTPVATIYLPGIIAANQAGQPTATPTVDPNAPNVKIEEIDYDPDDDPLQEYVEIENEESVPVDMTGWTLSDAGNNIFTFPAFTLQPGAMVRVWVITGTSDAQNLYWGRGLPIWNNSGDTATLKDATGAVIDTYSYPVSTATPTTTPDETPTATPTTDPNAPNVKIEEIDYDPDDDPLQEYVEIENEESSPVDMTGWTLSDAGNNIFTFPAFTLQPGAMVRVWVITGTNDAQNLYWGRGLPIWNNSGDTATLKDATGAVVDIFSYGQAPTPTSTPTPDGTPTPMPTIDPNAPNVKIEEIDYDPDDDPLQEYVEIENEESVPVDMTGWTLSDAGNNTFTFPAFTLQPGAMVRVWVITGTNEAQNLYWGRGLPIWNNSGDTATLKDATGAVVDIFSYAPTVTPEPTGTATLQPIPTGTPPAEAVVKIVHIEYNPDGDDLEGEYVDIRNVSDNSTDLNGWSLRDAADNPNVYRFPAFTLQPQTTVRVWMKAGTDNNQNLYAGFGRSILNNTGDGVMLSDATGQPVHWCRYEGGETGHSCQ